ncbi:hypothetical protein KIH39_06265 [Telmatocola sphagniphila]|uniref:Uncharacterized protein n=1 Tax=Telmatocola sphagniphila TaxID=1123043 RepID=A0A8E6B854_9BACT|nr:hypothetical protein [Telmatocola sphagniphila]QVL33511.1 hypothetical protein KIH39_06265 [Telmatocola sphagniphila]
MNNTALFRRGVVLPLNDQAEENLRCNHIDKSAEVRYLPIQSEELFNDLCSQGLFHEINRRCGSFITDKESELVEAALIPSLLVSVDFILQKGIVEEENVSNFLKDLRYLTTQAYDLNRPLIFVL